jgi:6-phospho-3-hexuloisomerase
MKSDGNDSMKSGTEQILEEVAACVRQVTTASLDQAGQLIAASPRIFVAGAGRSGLCMRAFAVRLMHLGKIVHVVGETTTPRILKTDLLILGSGSGRTAGLLTLAHQAKREGAQILLFTTDGTSPLAEQADLHVVIPAPSLKSTEGSPGPTSVQPMGTLFEQSLLILCDCLVFDLMQRTGVSSIQMSKRHANLE